MHRRFLGLITPFIFSLACTTYDKQELDNLNGEVRVIGHAGSGFTAWLPFNAKPGNSMASLKAALKNGADGLEVDVHMTADGGFLLYHDNQLDSKTNVSGCPSDYPLDSLKGLDYRLDFPFHLFGKHQLITLDELVDYLKGLEEFPELHLDLRNHSSCHDEDWDLEWEVRMIKTLKSSIKQWEIPKSKILLISYSKTLMEEAIKLEVPAKLSFEIVGELENGSNWAREVGIEILTIKPKLLSPEISKRLHKEGFELITFGAKSRRGSKKLLELNPDVIQSNNVPALLDLLDRD